MTCYINHPFFCDISKAKYLHPSEDYIFGKATKKNHSNVKFFRVKYKGVLFVYMTGYDHIFFIYLHFPGSYVSICDFHL